MDVILAMKPRSCWSQFSADIYANFDDNWRGNRHHYYYCTILWRKKNIGKVQQAIETMYLFIFAASVLLSIVGNIFSSDIFRLIDLPEEVIPQAVLYFNIYALGFVFFFGFQGTSAILRGLGDSKTPLYFLIVATLMNIGLDLLFVVVFDWGGIEGVAFATIISQAGAFFFNHHLPESFSQSNTIQYVTPAF